jgi:hypothetical protein
VPVRIISRREWGARSVVPGGRNVPLSSRRFFVCHWPVMRNQDEMAWVRAIEQGHLNTARANGWAAVAPFYNYLVGQSGAVYEGCGRDVRGIHSPPRNTDGFGVCLLQGSDAQGNNRTPMSQNMRTGTRELWQLLNQQAGRTLQQWWHGRDFATACPGPDIRAWVQGGMVAQGGGAAPAPPTPTEEEKMVATANAGRDAQGNAHVFRVTADGGAVDYTWKGSSGKWDREGGGWRAGMSRFAAAPEGHRIQSIDAWNDGGVLTVVVRSRNDGSLWVTWQAAGSTNWSGGGSGRIAAFQHFAR